MVAIVPAPLVSTNRDIVEPLEALPVLRWWVRFGLVAVAAGLVVIFVIAVWLRPYDADGRPYRLGTHQQLGLPPCQFYFVTRLPCPSCGMSTSFALLTHGDVVNSLRANWVGTLLAGFCLLLIPWSLASAYRQRPLFIRSLERAMFWAALVFLSLMLLRWVVVVAIELQDRWGS